MVHPFHWFKGKIENHPGMTGGAILGGALGSVLGPFGLAAGVGLGASIGNNLDRAGK